MSKSIEIKVGTYEKDLGGLLESCCKGFYLRL